MPGRTSTFKLTGIRKYVDNIKNTVSQETARDIVKDLQFLGPWYSGEFATNWVVRLGEVTISATKERSPASWYETGKYGIVAEKPSGRDAMPGPDGGVPRPKGRKSIIYTIGNRMKYRNIAMDLVPGRFKDGKNNTAGQDWYLLYADGTSSLLNRRIAQNTQRAVQGADKVSGFKNLGVIRGELGI